MKNYILYLFLSIGYFSSVAQVSVDDTVYLNPGYSNMSYYSLLDGEVANIAKGGWDLQIGTSPFSAAIRVNDGANVQLYLPTEYDTSDWAVIDTSGMRLYLNSDSSWENGAFNRMSTGHPDYGWGEYNDVTHDIFGNKMFVLHMSDGSYKKIFIEKFAADGTVAFRFADLSDPGYTSVSFDRSAYSTKKFVMYSLSGSGSMTDPEPLEADWDLVFRQYQIPIDPLPAYAVAGALTASPVLVAQRDGDAESNDYSGLAFSNIISEIGSDWKMYTGSWELVPERSYFLMDRDTNFFKIVFTGFGGSMTGMIAFSKTNLEESSAIPNSSGSLAKLAVYPNPVQTTTDVIIGMNTAERLPVSLMDITGNILFSTDRNFTNGMNSFELNMTNYHSGMYVLKIGTGANAAVQRIWKQ